MSLVKSAIAWAKQCESRMKEISIHDPLHDAPILGLSEAFNETECDLIMEMLTGVGAEALAMSPLEIPDNEDPLAILLIIKKRHESLFELFDLLGVENSIKKGITKEMSDAVTGMMKVAIGKMPFGMKVAFDISGFDGFPDEDENDDAECQCPACKLSREIKDAVATEEVVH